MTEEKILNEKQDSIKLNHNSKGYTWEIKLYYDLDKITSAEIIQKIKKIDEELKISFGGTE